MKPITCIGSILYSQRKHKYNDSMNPDFQYGQPTQPVQPQPQPMQPQQPVNPYQQQPQSYAPLQPPVNNYIAPGKPSKKWLIIAIVFIATTVVALGFAGYATYNYFDQKDNVDAKVSTAVNDAVKVQADKDAADFLQKEKQPNRLFAGPEDYGGVSFDYPKTWSIYVAKDTTTNGGTYTAYFNPVTVPPVSDTTQYALRVTIEQRDTDKVIASYDDFVKKGDLKASAVKIDDTDGTRLDGNFTKDIRGSAVIFKIRDKTVTIRSDAETFKGDFDALVQTIKFNK